MTDERLYRRPPCQAVVPVSRIRLHGRLRTKFGKEYRLGVTTPAAAIYALCRLVPGFREELEQGHYRMRRGPYHGGVNLPTEGLMLRLPPGGEMHIIPCVAGAKGGTGKMIVGAVAVVASVALMQPEIAAGVGMAEDAAVIGADGAVSIATGAVGAGLSTALIGGFTVGNLALAGGALFLTGLLQAISPQPKANSFTYSFLLSGLTNTSRQGLPVPVVYGRMRVGSQSISMGYEAVPWYTPNSMLNQGEEFAPALAGMDPNGYPTIPAGNSGPDDTVSGTTNDIYDLGSHPFLGGSGGGGGKGGSGGGYNAPDTVHSNAIVRIIDVLSEGPIGGLVNGAQSIFFNGTPLANPDGTWNFAGVAFVVRYGEPDQTPVDGFPAQETSVPIGLQVKQQTGPVVQTVNDPNATAIRITMSFPALVYAKPNGDLLPIPSLTWTVEIRPSGPGWVGNWYLAGTSTLNNVKASSTYEYSTRYDLPLANGATLWDVRVTRITPDSSDITKYQMDSYWGRLDIIDDHRLMYPNTAYICYQFNAALFGSQLPSRQVEIYGRVIDVPANYNPGTRGYSSSGAGTTNGTWDLVSTIQRPCDNPAFIFLDMLRNTRYGCGILDQYLSSTKADLYTIAQYCDGLVPDGYGGTEPRYAVNAVIATQDDAYRVLQLISGAFRGNTYWGSGQVVAICDMPRAATKLVNQTNIVDGEFSYEGSSLRTRHNVFNVNYIDKNNRYLPAIEVVYDTLDIAQRGPVPTDVIAWGCVSRSLAHRLGKWALYTEKNQTEVVSYKGGPYHLDVRPGDIVKVADPAYMGLRMSGRLRPASVPPSTNLIASSLTPTWVPGGDNTVTAGGVPSAAYAGAAVSTHTRGSSGVSNVGAITVTASTPGRYVCSVNVWLPNGFAGQQVQLIAQSGAVTSVALGVALSDGTDDVLELDDGTVLQVGGTADVPQSDSALNSLTGTWQRLACQIDIPSPGVTLSMTIAVTGASGTVIYSYGPMIDGVSGGLASFSPTSAGALSLTQIDLDSVLAGPDPGVAYQVSVVMPDGTIDDLVPITSWVTHTNPDLTQAPPDVNPPYTTLLLGRPLKATPSQQAEWIITSTELQPREFDIRGVSEDGKGIVSITAIQHDPNKYAIVELGIAFDEAPYSLLPQILLQPLPAPSNVTARDYMTGVGSTQVLRVTVGWTAPLDPRIGSFQVSASATGYFNQWSVGFVSSYDIDNLPVGLSMTFQVRSVGYDGKTSVWASAQAIVVDGKVDPPVAPAAVTAIGGTRRVQITWQAIADRQDIANYEVWRGSTSSNGPGAGATLIATVNATGYTDADSTTLLPNTTWFYWVRGIANATPVVPGAFGGPAAATTTLLIVDDLANGIINTAKFAQGLAGVNLISDLTGTGVTGQLYLNTSDQKLYKWNGTQYVAVVTAVDMVGQLTSDQIASLNATKVAGQLTAAQIASIASTQITGQLTDSQLAAISAAKLTGQITSTQITDSAITTSKLSAGSVTTAALAAGAVTASTVAANAITSAAISAGAVTTAALAAGAVTAGTIATNAITTAAISAGAVTATQLAAGSVTTAALAVGSASNWCWNSCMELAADGWNYGIASGMSMTEWGTTNGTSYASTWRVPGIGSGFMHSTSSMAVNTGYMLVAWDPSYSDSTNPIGIPCKAGDVIEGSAYLIAQRCVGRVFVQFYDSSNNVLSTVAGTRIVANPSDGKSLAQYGRSWCVGTAPANAVLSRLLIQANNDGLSDATALWGANLGSNPYLFFTEASIGPGVPNATGPQPWQPGGVTTISGSMIKAATITGNRIAANTITAGNILANSITSGVIAAGAITASQIAAGAIHASMLASDFQLTQSAQIGTAVIGTAQIQNLSVGTSQIAGSAVSGIVASQNTSSGALSGLPSNLVAVTVTIPSGSDGRVLINYAAAIDCEGGQYTLQVSRNGTAIWGLVGNFGATCFGDAPGPGTWTYTLSVTSAYVPSGDAPHFYYATLTATLFNR